MLLCAIKLVFVSSLRLDVLSGSLSLLCAIKFVFASLLRQDVTDRLALDAKVSRALSIKRWRTLSTSTLSSCYRCTRHRISPVNACVYLAAKLLLFLEASKHSSYFFSISAIRCSRSHARHEPTPSQTKLHVAQRVRPTRKNNPS